MYHVKKDLLEGGVRYAVNFHYFYYHVRSSRYGKLLGGGRKSNSYSVHSQPCIKCASV